MVILSWQCTDFVTTSLWEQEKEGRNRKREANKGKKQLTYLSSSEMIAMPCGIVESLILSYMSPGNEETHFCWRLNPEPLPSISLVFSSEFLCWSRKTQYGSASALSRVSNCRKAVLGQTGKSEPASVNQDEKSRALPGQNAEMPIENIP